MTVILLLVGVFFLLATGTLPLAVSLYGLVMLFNNY